MELLCYREGLVHLFRKAKPDLPSGDGGGAGLEEPPNAPTENRDERTDCVREEKQATVSSTPSERWSMSQKRIGRPTIFIKGRGT
jgi:hypothetical protein